MDRFDCRNQLESKRTRSCYKIEEHTHSVGHSERSGAIVEPYLSTQWFVKMKPLAQELLDNQNTKDKLTFSQVDLKIHSIAGWKKLEVDDFVNYGGDTKYLLGIIKTQVKSLLVKRLKTSKLDTR